MSFIFHPRFKAKLRTLVLAVACCFGCAGPPQTPVIGTNPTGTSAAQVLTAADVQLIVQKAAESVDAAVTIAVTDRSGNILAIYEKAGAPPTSIGDFGATVS